MINSTQSVNSLADVATLSERVQSVSQNQITNQSAAMQAALQVCRQYSRESKSNFRQECLDHLRASLAPAKDASV